MIWTNENMETLLVCAMLVLFAASITVVFSVILGAALAYHAHPTFRYGSALALLFVPFAIGNSVWAYSVSRLISCFGMQDLLVATDKWTRTTVLLLVCVARTIPLGTFFCATTLHRYTSEIRPYLQTHHIYLPFFLLCSLYRIPKSILMLLGLFGGALMATESPLPTFLYRANPGTPPETANIMLARIFRELYASAGPDCLSRVATFGLIISLVFIISAFLGTFVGVGLLRVTRNLLGRYHLFTGIIAKTLSTFACFGIIAALFPGILSLIGIFAPARIAETSDVDLLEQIFSYSDIIILGLLVGGTVTIIGIALAIRLRYNQKDLLTWLENKPIAACLLMVPAFVPTLTIVAALGQFSNGKMDDISSYLSMFINHLGLHYPVFQFICLSLIAAIPERHVSWQRATKIRYSFSLMTDGFKRHFAVLIGLLSLCTVQVVNDGTVSRWFSHLVKAPTETLYAAVFGRLSNATEAAMISWSVGFIAIAICSILASTYIRDLVNQPQND